MIAQFFNGTTAEVAFIYVAGEMNRQSQEFSESAKTRMPGHTLSVSGHSCFIGVRSLSALFPIGYSSAEAPFLLIIM